MHSNIVFNISSECEFFPHPLVMSYQNVDSHEPMTFTLWIDTLEKHIEQFQRWIYSKMPINFAIQNSNQIGQVPLYELNVWTYFESWAPLPRLFECHHDFHCLVDWCPSWHKHGGCTPLSS